VLSGRFLRYGLIPHPEVSCRIWCVWVWSDTTNNTLHVQGAEIKLSELRK